MVFVRPAAGGPPVLDDFHVELIKGKVGFFETGYEGLVLPGEEE